MAKRPAPMKSTLAGSSPVTAAPLQPAEAPATDQVATQAPAPAVEAEPAPVAIPATTPARKAKKAKTKVAYYQETEDAERVRGAFQQVGHLEGYQTFSDFHAAVVMREVERLEKLHNGGKPFDGAAPRTGRLGRPLA